MNNHGLGYLSRHCHPMISFPVVPYVVGTVSPLRSRVNKDVSGHRS
jgi:hypothetical protein